MCSAALRPRPGSICSTPGKRSNRNWRKAMGHFKLMNLFFRLMPFHSWKAGLLRGHIEKCPACAKCLASREEARRVLVQIGDVGNLDRMWPAVSEKIGGIACAGRIPDVGVGAREAKSRSQAGWRFAAAAAGLDFGVVLTIGLVRFFRSAPGPGPGWRGRRSGTVANPLCQNRQRTRPDVHFQAARLRRRHRLGREEYLRRGIMKNRKQRF